MNKQLQYPTTSILTDYLSELSVSEFELLYTYCLNKMFTCIENNAIGLYLERIYEHRGDWMIDFTESSFGMELYKCKVNNLTEVDQLELIHLIEEII